MREELISHGEVIHETEHGLKLPKSGGILAGGVYDLLIVLKAYILYVKIVQRFTEPPCGLDALYIGRTDTLEVFRRPPGIELGKRQMVDVRTGVVFGQSLESFPFRPVAADEEVPGIWVTGRLADLPTDGLSGHPWISAASGQLIYRPVPVRQTINQKITSFLSDIGCDILIPM